jgi:hypothetical protein
MPAHHAAPRATDGHPWRRQCTMSSTGMNASGTSFTDTGTNFTGTGSSIFFDI